MKCPFHTAPWRTADYDAKQLRMTPGNEHDELAEDPWTKDLWNRPCAFVVTVFGHDAGYCQSGRCRAWGVDTTYGYEAQDDSLAHEGRGRAMAAAVESGRVGTEAS